MRMQWEGSSVKLRWHNRGHGQSPSVSQDKMWRWLLSVLRCFLNTNQNLGFSPKITITPTVLREISLFKFLSVIAILLKVSQELRNFKLHYYPYSWKNNCKGRRYLQCLDVTLTLTWVCCQDDSGPTTELKCSHEQLWAIFLGREWCWFYTVNNYEEIITSSSDQRQA